MTSITVRIKTASFIPRATVKNMADMQVFIDFSIKQVKISAFVNFSISIASIINLNI